MLEQMTRVNQHVQLVPRRERFSLLSGEAEDARSLQHAALSA
jgi:hypothetical protein